MASMANLTDRARKAVDLAYQAARKRGHQYVGTEHLLIGLLEGDGIAHVVLRDLGVAAKIEPAIDLLLDITTCPHCGKVIRKEESHG